MAEYETGYQAMPYSDNEDEGDTQGPDQNIVHVVPNNNRARWNHIEDLDEFFTRVYHYHQRSGFVCMVLQDVLQIIQFLFVVTFSTFLIKCVNYDILFYEAFLNSTHKVTISEAVYGAGQCIERFDSGVIICITIAMLFWCFRFIKFLYNLFKYLETRAFYTQALNISAAELGNMTWHEVQKRLLDVQKEQQMCIHKQELTELDIYHRILRFKNYMISMVNKSLLQLKFNVPCIGEYGFLTTGLKYNLEMLLFWGPWSPFENNWHLRSEYKDHHKRKLLAEQLGRKICWIGIANLILSPVILLWQILYSFFRYAEVVKREPGLLGARRWSLFARLYTRHFNELDHEFDARLNRAYKPSERYMNIFTSPVIVILAKHGAFFSGSLLAVLVILTVIDEDVLNVQHMIAIMTGLGLILHICRACIPEEHLVWCPELLMKHILAEIHYMPDSWQGNAHTNRVRYEFSQLFQYKILYLFEELLSPLITPLILCFKIRPKALEIVDFFRNYTVEVTGVGDVCSFAQMDIRKHGHPQWVAPNATTANVEQQAENGKTELSLLHFTLTNPEWRPPQRGSEFLNNLKSNAHKDVTAMSTFPTADNPLFASLHSLSSGGYYGYNSMISMVMQQSNVAHVPQSGSFMSGPDTGPCSMLGPVSIPSPVSTNIKTQPPVPIRGGLRHAEGPVGGGNTGILASLQQPSSSGTEFPSLPPLEMPLPYSAQLQAQARGLYNEESLEYLAKEMSFSALYMHELHRRRMFEPFFNSPDVENAHGYLQPGDCQGDNDSTPDGAKGGFELDVETRDVAFLQSSSSAGAFSGAQGPAMELVSFGPLPRMPNIQEGDEEEMNNENQPLLDSAPPSTRGAFGPT